MADHKCYAVVEFEKWKSHSEVVNKNNHNFRVNPVEVLKPTEAVNNEVMSEPEGANVKERWIKLCKILDEEMEKKSGRKEGMSLDEYKRAISKDEDLRAKFIEHAAEAGFKVSEKHAAEMIALTAEGIDLKKYYDNQNLAGGRSNFIQQFEDRLASKGIKKVRKNAVMEIGVVMKVTKGFENLPKDFDLEKWKADSMKWLEKEFGKENILSAVYHADEFGPHIQASIIPITDDGRLCAKEFLPDWTAYSKAQDTYYETVKQDGIYRGVKGCQPGFEDQRRAHNALVASGDIDLPEPKNGEKIEEYHTRANEAFKEAGMQSHLKIKDAEREHMVEMEGAEERVRELETALDDSQKREKILKERVRTLTAENGFYREQLQGTGATTRELKNAADVAAKLKEEYEAKMKALKQKEARMSDKIISLQKDISAMTKESNEIKNKLELYNKIIIDNKLSAAALSNNAMLNYISYAFVNGYPRSDETKKAMQDAYNWGKSTKDRIQNKER